MLELLRRAVKSWVAQVLLGLLVVSFAVWGIGDVASGFSTTVATVGGQSVEADAYARALRREQQRYGLDATQIRSTGLDRFVLGQMVREAAFADAAERLSLSAPDAAVARQVRSDPAFQVGGAFDPAQYEAAVRRIFPSIAEFEESVRDRLIVNQIGLAAQVGAQAPDPTVTAIANFREERRAFDAVTVRAEPDTDAPLDEDALQAHLDANVDVFLLPERRAVRWIEIDPAALAGPIEDEAVRAAYEAAGDLYVVPETRPVRQLVFPDAAAAQAARDRLEAGDADFAGLAAERGLTPDDTLLGDIAKGELDDARDAAVFGLGPEGGVAGPVAAPTGPAILSVGPATPEIVTPFEDVRGDLEAMLAAERGRPAADALAEEVEDLRAAGAPLEEVAAELDAPLREAPALEAQGPAGEDPVMAAVRAEAFAAEEGEERPVRRLPDGGYVAVHVDGVAPPRAPTLDEAREAVAADLRRARAVEQAQTRAQEIAEAVRGGASLSEAAGSLDVEPVGPLRRGDPDPRLGDAARAALFAADAQIGDVAVDAGRDRVVVAVLRGVTEPEADGPRQAVAQALSQSLAQDYLEFLGRALQDEAGVTINTQAVESVLAQIGA
jgi:peptidyl-prolyl cis-trans isomerase D